jgi:putative transposase
LKYDTIFLGLSLFAQGPTLTSGSDPKAMPAKNSRKQFIENGYYHVYNRGVEKRDIFMDENDYAVFLYYLKSYLVSGSDPHSLANEVKLISFCLMPNHFHLLVKQITLAGMTKLIRAVCTSYVMYFNKKYKRVGTLFQGKYKAVLIDSDEYLLHLSRYIHLNPASGSDPKTYKFSSYGYYLGRKKAEWLKTDIILNYFKTNNRINLKNCLSYESFVDDYRIDSEEYLQNLTLEQDE